MLMCQDNAEIKVGKCQFDQDPASHIVSQLLDRVCPSNQCSDVDRAILGASLGG